MYGNVFKSNNQWSRPLASIILTLIECGGPKSEMKRLAFTRELCTVDSKRLIYFWLNTHKRQLFMTHCMKPAHCQRCEFHKLSWDKILCYKQYGWMYIHTAIFIQARSYETSSFNICFKQFRPKLLISQISPASQKNCYKSDFF